ncbi:MAG: hypothetical protein KA296_16995 [Marinobacter sp.]|nr:hypothetical protein [Marinobacter sp.]
MNPILMLCFAIALTGCQSLPSSDEGKAKGVVFLKREHCLTDYIEDLKRVHFGPCLTVASVNGKPPATRPDGFIELPVNAWTSLGVYCIYRSQDNTVKENSSIYTTVVLPDDQFTQAGKRWYLHAHTDVLHAKGCKPTLSRSLQGRM